MTRGVALASVTAAVLLGLPAVSQAATIVVDDFDDVDLVNDPADGDCSLREAIQAAATNATVDTCAAGEQGPALDTVQLASGTYEVVGLDEENSNARGDLDVLADPGSGAAGPLLVDGVGAGTVIDAVAADGNNDRAIDLRTGDLELQDLTVQGGRMTSNDFGGGISATGRNLTLDAVTISGNSGISGATATAGGGISFVPASAATLTIEDSSITGNSADDGAGVYVGAGSIAMHDSVVSGNTINEPAYAGSVRGAGLAVFGTGGSILRSTISNNSASQPNGSPSGGGVLLSISGSLLVGESAITGNTVSVGADGTDALFPGGGGIWTTAGDISIRNTTIAGNTVDDGTADNFGGGGGIFAGGGTLRITHSTLATNSSPYGDAYAQFGGGTTTLKNSIIDDQDLDTSDTCDYNAGLMPTSAGHNVAMGTTCIDGTGTGDQAGTNPMLETGGLATWGGPTQTIPPQLTSPAVDLVQQTPASECDDGEASSTLLTADQRGFPRPFDGNGDSTAECDAGAVEVYPCNGENATIVGDGAANTLTGTAGINVVHGAGGNDTLNGRGGADHLCGGDGSDTASFADAPSAVDAAVGTGSSGGDGSDAFDSIESLTGSIYNDNLDGDGLDNALSGGGGNDTLAGHDGDDDFDGGGGTDLADFTQGPGISGMTINLASDTASGDGSTDEPLTSIEDVIAPNGTDDITGGPEVNDISGRGGNDTIDPGGGADVVDAGDDADELLVRDGVADQVNCGTGGTPDTATDTVTADLEGVDQLTNCLAPDVVDFEQPSPPTPPSGSCAGKAATIAGTNAAEVLTGTPAADVIDAKGGSDTVRSLGGNDMVCGVAGNDRLIGGGGNDRLIGGGGRDTLKGGAGKDKLLGKGGRDRCIGGGGRDRGRGCELRRTI